MQCSDYCPSMPEDLKSEYMNFKERIFNWQLPLFKNSVCSLGPNPFWLPTEPSAWKVSWSKNAELPLPLVVTATNSGFNSIGNWTLVSAKCVHQCASIPLFLYSLTESKSGERVKWNEMRY